MQNHAAETTLKNFVILCFQKLLDSTIHTYNYNLTPRCTCIWLASGRTRRSSIGVVMYLPVPGIVGVMLLAIVVEVVTLSTVNPVHFSYFPSPRLCVFYSTSSHHPSLHGGLFKFSSALAGISRDIALMFSSKSLLSPK